MLDTEVSAAQGCPDKSPNWPGNPANTAILPKWQDFTNSMQQSNTAASQHRLSLLNSPDRCKVVASAKRRAAKAAF